jgi:uncharacterized protein DUF4157/type III HopA1-like effector protein
MDLTHTAEHKPAVAAESTHEDLVGSNPDGSTSGLPLYLSARLPTELRMADPNDPVERGQAVSPAVTQAIPHGMRDAVSRAVAPGAGAGGVRVHEDRQAAQLAQTLSARAFTVGQDIFMGSGVSAAERGRVLSHEVQHVAQQAASGSVWIGRDPVPTLDVPFIYQAPAILKQPVSTALLFAVMPGLDDQTGKGIGEAAVAAIQDQIDPEQETAIRARANEVGALRANFNGTSVGLANALHQLETVLSTAESDDVKATHSAVVYLIDGTAGDIAYHLSEGLNAAATPATTPAAPSPSPQGGGTATATAPAPAVQVLPFTWLAAVQGDLERVVQALQNGQSLLQIELEATVHKLVELRARFATSADQQERATIGTEIGIQSRKALLLNRQLVATQAIPGGGQTPLDQSVQNVAAQIASIRNTARTERDTIQQLGDTPDRLAVQNIDLSSFRHFDLVPDRADVNPEEAVPETLDRAISAMQAELAARLRAQTAEAKRLHDQLIPKHGAYTLSQFSIMHGRWFSMFSQEQERQNPMYKLLVGDMLGDVYGMMGSGVLTGFSAAEGAVARYFLMRFLAGQLRGAMGGGTTQFTSQMARFAPQRQQAPVTGSAASPTYKYGQVFPGNQASDPNAEASSRANLLQQRQSDTQRLRDPDWSKQSDIQRHIDAVQASAIPPKAPLVPIAPRGPVNAQTGWSYLVDVYTEGPYPELIMREQKVMSPDMANYFLLRQQQYATLKTPHQPQTQSGQPIGDEGMRARGLEGATANAVQRYLQGRTDAPASPEGNELRQAIEEAQRAGVPVSARNPDEANQAVVAQILAEIEDYLNAFFDNVKDGTTRVAAVLVIASREFNLGDVVNDLTDPAAIGKMAGLGAAIGLATSALKKLGPLGNIAASGLHAYLGAGGTNPIAASATIVTFIHEASGVSDFIDARVWAVMALTAIHDMSELFGMMIMAPATALGEMSGEALLNRITRNPPSTPREMFDICRPMLNSPQSRAEIIQGTRARLAELTLEGAQPGSNPEYDSLIAFEKMLRPYETAQSVSPMEPPVTDPAADLPLAGAKTETKEEEFFAAHLVRTAEERAALYDAIPPDLRTSVVIVEQSDLPAHTVRVRYDRGELHVEVGPRAEASHIRAHVEVARQLNQYQGIVGSLRRLLSHLGTVLRITPGYGTQGFESRLEVQKLRAIEADLQARLAAIEARAERLSKDPTLATKAAERDAIIAEIESIQSQIDQHTATLNSYEPGRGFVAAYAARDARSSLDMLLRDAWQRGPQADVYNLYSQRSAQTPMSPEARQRFGGEVRALAGNEDLGQIVIQNRDVMTHFTPAHPPSAAQIEGAGFIHFYRSDYDSTRVTERIYLNVHPDHASEVFGFVVNDMMRPVEHPYGADVGIHRQHGITAAKIGGPRVSERRADTLVIYCQSQADVQWGLDRLLGFQAEHPGAFLEEMPAGAQPVLGLWGVATAAQPTAGLPESFGMYIENVVNRARSTQPPPATYDEFRNRVRSLMQADGIDPDHPDRLTRHNATVAGGTP